MKINKIVPFIVIITWIILLSFPAYANDALSYLFMRCFYAFIFGSIWVLIVEYVYCVIIFRKTGYLRNFLFVITANVVTTIMGFFVMGLMSDSYVYLEDYGSMRNFLTCYVCTVPVEAIILKLFLKSTEGLTFLSAFINAVLFNVLSYIGIVVIFYNLTVTPG